MNTLSTLPPQTFTANIRPELALLLCCARTKVGSEHAERIRNLLRGAIDWQYLIGAAHTHGVLPLLSRSLHASCSDAVPKVILDQLQRHFHANAFHNRFLAKALLKLFALFETQGIHAIPYKGPVLAAVAYGDLSLRQFTDLDVLIHKSDFAKAKELLIAQGYQPEFTNTQETSLLQFHYHLGFVRGDGKVPVELHWGLTWRYWSFPLEFERLWAHRGSVGLEGRTISSLPAEDLLLILCVHGGKHWWERLMWICDIAELVQAHRQIDWQRLLEQARSWGGKRILLLGLFLANDLLGTDLPKVVWQSIAVDPRVKSLAGQLKSQTLSGVHGLHNDRSRPVFYRTTFYLGVRERLRDKVQFFIRYPLRPYLSTLPKRLSGLLKRPPVS